MDRDSRRLYCYEIEQLTWRRRVQELICGGNNFEFNAFVYLESLQCNVTVINVQLRTLRTHAQSPDAMTAVTVI